MQFLVIAHDHADVLELRLQVRPAHVRLGNQMRDQGQLLFVVGILNEKQDLAGSMMVLQLGSRSELDEWLKREPYMTQGIWDPSQVEVHICKVGPSFSTD